MVKNWFKFKSIQNIQLFTKFANFYQLFIQEFSTITISSILILKVTVLSQIKDNKIKKTSDENNDRLIKKLAIS